MKRDISAIDSTTLKLSLFCIDWARRRRRKAAAKTHMRLNVGTMLPSFAIVEDASHVTWRPQMAGAFTSMRVFLLSLMVAGTLRTRPEAKEV